MPMEWMNLQLKHFYSVFWELYVNNITTRMGWSQDLYTIMDPNTAGYSEHIYCQHTQEIAWTNRYYCAII
jgi:hypothetical protein